MTLQDSLVEQSSQGGFIPEGRHDILAAAIGQPEHPGRVRGVGSGVGIRQFFGSSSRQPNTNTVSPELLQKLKEEIYKEIEERMMQKFQGYDIRPPSGSPQQDLQAFVPPTGKINNIFPISYELNKCYLMKCK